MRIVSVPMIDGDPVKMRAEISLHLPGEISCEGAQIRHLRCILRRNNKAKMVAIIFATRCEGDIIGIVICRVKHCRWFMIACDAITLQIGKVTGDGGASFRERALAGDPRLDHDASL